MPENKSSLIGNVSYFYFLFFIIWSKDFLVFQGLVFGLVVKVNDVHSLFGYIVHCPNHS